jgi:hypothetical protein
MTTTPVRDTAEPPVVAARVRPGWQEHLRDATDLALVGFAVVLAALPVVTAGSAVATGSAAVRHRCDHGTLPPAGDLLRAFVRGILPGLAASLVAGAAAGLLALDVSAARAGTMPGGPATVPLIALVALVLLGYAGLTIVHIGASLADGVSRANGADGAGGGAKAAGWRRAVRLAAATRGRRLALVPCCAGVLVMAVLLGSLVPATVPLLAGFSLFALHVIHRRLTA